MLDDLPSTALGVLGFALCLIPAIGLGLLHWSDYTGLSLNFLRRGDSHGSARLSTRKERAALQRGEGLLIGRDADSARLLRYDGPAHLLTLAPTRAGKGVGTIIPNLLTAKRSVLVIDPKGENARITARARSGLGPVHVFDPFGVTGLPTAACNPLDRLQREVRISVKTRQRLPKRWSWIRPDRSPRPIGTKRPKPCSPG
ncbi:type IV secretory system conjugative DNA transfer family protein [Paracoccus cavernae]|uniref:type IV secretory system conjugative DNA transfer family protein n=1 Tax=Paracoccus cavernae TaxID=1571207 RepID=UPI003639AEE1